MVSNNSLIYSSRRCPRCNGCMHYKADWLTFLTKKRLRECLNVDCAYNDQLRVKIVRTRSAYGYRPAAYSRSLTPGHHVQVALNNRTPPPQHDSEWPAFSTGGLGTTADYEGFANQFAAEALTG
jgi:hypothetical protein